MTNPQRKVLVAFAPVIATTVLGAVFVVSAVSKAINPAPFRAVVDTLVATTIDLPGRSEVWLLLPLTICVIV